ncbi:hypothetical protein [Paraburkholderia aromaticivorans]|uniref:hypothetical protein n=1 Tax=Paraburkholderia aromaticivorans TaxID=2026199 RepID=UPI0038B96CF6
MTGILAAKEKFWLIFQPGNEYQALCNELGQNKGACFTMRAVVLFATLYAPAGTLTAIDAITFATFCVGITRLFFRNAAKAIRAFRSQMFPNIAVPIAMTSRSSQESIESNVEDATCDATSDRP